MQLPHSASNTPAAAATCRRHDPSQTPLRTEHEYPSAVTPHNANKQQHIVMTGLQRSKDVFPFFDLPLEMREMIYDESMQDREGSLKCGGLDYKASNMPRTNLLLVSKQFGHEYNSRARKAQRTLLLQDNYHPINPNYLRLPSQTAECTSVMVSIHIHPRCAKWHINHHRDWLSGLMVLLPSQPSCDSIRIEIEISHRDLANDDRRTELEGLVRTLSQASPVRFSAQVFGASKHWDRKSRSGLLDDPIPQLTWSCEKKKLENIPGPKG